MKKKQCFLISPIGDEGTDTRKHADNVFKYIIKRAMDQCDVHVFRSDHLYETGKISDHMLKSLVREDFCVALLTGRNPNVYYELAVAQAAARPVIMMLQKGEVPPFDIKDLRCVYYDFEPEALMEGHYVAEMVKHVKALEATGWKAPCIFGDLSPLGAGADYRGAFKFHKKSDDFGPPDAWLQLFQETKNSFDIMGISLGAWKRGKGFSEGLARKASDGCKVRVLLMHQDNPCLRHLVNDAIPEVDVSGVIREVEAMHDFFSKLSVRNPGIQVRRIMKGCPHFQMTRTDQRAVFIQYLYSQKTGWSPLWECEHDTSLYNALGEEFELLWQANDLE